MKVFILSFNLQYKEIRIKIFITIIFPAVLCWCVYSSSHIEERTLRVFENRVLRKIFGPKRYKITRNCTRLHEEELYEMHYSPNIMRVIKSRRTR
jgi:hypothetical protein